MSRNFDTNSVPRQCSICNPLEDRQTYSAQVRTQHKSNTSTTLEEQSSFMISRSVSKKDYQSYYRPFGTGPRCRKTITQTLTLKFDMPYFDTYVYMYMGGLSMSSGMSRATHIYDQTFSDSLPNPVIHHLGSISSECIQCSTELLRHSQNLLMPSTSYFLLQAQTKRGFRPFFAGGHLDLDRTFNYSIQRYYRLHRLSFSVVWNMTKKREDTTITW